MKQFLFFLALFIGSITYANAQTGREVHGTVIDSTKVGLPGSTIKLTSDVNENITSIANPDGKFSFTGIKGTKLTLTVSSIGFEGLIKHYTLAADGQPADVGTIVLKAESRLLGVVTVVGTNAVTLKEDTVEYRASAYAVRANSPVEDQLRKIPGVDVDAQGNVSAQGKQVTKVRINGKDFFGGDVQTATKNLPADLVESYQIVDDYGDQASITGIKTGEPNKILNITIRKDKNNGYFGQLTAGDGSDALPKDPGVTNDNRYVGLLNYFRFNNDQQISVLGNLNNTNVNTFSFGNATPGGGGGNFGGGGGNRGGGGGGGRGNAARGGGGQTSNQNGINTVRTIGTNFRDQWGKNLSVYGSYSFADNEVFTRSTNFQTNSTTTATLSRQNSIQNDATTNHRFTWNMEYRPDTLNYFKLTPTFAYGTTTTNGQDTIAEVRPGQRDSLLAYNVRSTTNSSAPNYSATLLYNHKFNNNGRNLSLNANAGSSRNYNLDNPVYAYEITSQRRLQTPADQLVNTYNRSNNVGISLSYIEPLSKVSYLELNYAYSNTANKSDNRTDTLVTGIGNSARNVFDLSTNNYTYTFTTNRVGLNYRYIKPKYNATLGVGLLPSVLDGGGSYYNIFTQSVANADVRKSTLNFVPTARFTYNFSRSQNLNFNYNGSNAQPSYNQLAPAINFSSPSSPSLGNPNLNPEFTNNINLRYNKFSFETGNIFFTNFSFTQTNNKIVNNITTYRNIAKTVLATNQSLKYLQNTNLVTYLNADGYYQGSANVLFSKPWSQRKYTLILNGNFSYTNNIGFSNSVDSLNRTLYAQPLKNIAKTLSFTPGVRFRVNILDVVDSEVSGSYGVNRTNNSVETPAFSNTNIRTLTLGINGKNYFWKDWTFSYDFSRLVNYGYSFDVPNPNILNMYVERRFLKANAATIRLQAFDVFNQNTGFAFSQNGAITTQTQTNRLGRYLLLTFTYRLQKFAGRAPAQGGGEGRYNRGGFGGGAPAGGPPGGGPGGPTIY